MGMRFEVRLRDRRLGRFMSRFLARFTERARAWLGWALLAGVRVAGAGEGPGGAWAAGASQPPVFPPVSAEALDKQRVDLPTGLEGQVNLLLLSFARDQANQVDTWTAEAQALQHTNFGFRAYRVPVAERENALFRWWANASLRSDETDPELWHWVVPLYVEKVRFRAQLGIADEKSVVALLVDRQGKILWRATGASSPGARAALAAAVVVPSGTR
jgi:hypothetical protein